MLVYIVVPESDAVVTSLTKAIHRFQSGLLVCLLLFWHKEEVLTSLNHVHCFVCSETISPQKSRDNLILKPLNTAGNQHRLYSRTLQWANNGCFMSSLQLTMHLKHTADIFNESNASIFIKPTSYTVTVAQSLKNVHVHMNELKCL